LVILFFSFCFVLCFFSFRSLPSFSPSGFFFCFFSFASFIFSFFPLFSLPAPF
jgi:hypothetical protein